MTFNVRLNGDYDLVMNHIRSYKNIVQSKSHEDFNGQTMHKRVTGLGFKTEEERLRFLLEMSDKVHACHATTEDIIWGYIPF